MMKNEEMKCKFKMSHLEEVLCLSLAIHMVIMDMRRCTKEEALPWWTMGEQSTWWSWLCEDAPKKKLSHGGLWGSNPQDFVKQTQARKAFHLVEVKIVVIKLKQFPELTMAGFADALRPDKFTGVHFKRWQIKATLWLTHLKVFHVSNGLPEGTISDQDQNKFKEDNTLFVGCVLSILADRLCDVYMHIVDGKELWDALNAKFGATDAGSELYIMESFHDIRMVNNRSVVEQAHEIQCIAKELELLKCALPDKFVAGCIIAKLPSSWRNFATTLKHKRQEISVENLIASLDVEEKARAKDTTEKGEGQSSANMVQKKPYSKNKGNNKPSFNKPMKTTTFKKKKMINKADLSCLWRDWPLF
ncbi:hypothetical protein QYE76_049336 [Lolium multiflorum]|uniref:Retrotransposon protein, putative, Ty1-copia subclass n=1 Tax=Lolium multiflorum TaxID=4521 RepID=A0AAD8WFZ2_LOLMU|nr:hypothetical protein QYE76_049336 [Lolium multiflorum]